MNKITITPITELVAELTDTCSETLSGGTIITPQGKAENMGKNPPSADNTATNTNIPNILNPASLGLTPFYPPLPKMKLAPLGSLKG